MAANTVLSTAHQQFAQRIAAALAADPRIQADWVVYRALSIANGNSPGLRLTFTDAPASQAPVLGMEMSNPFPNTDVPPPDGGDPGFPGGDPGFPGGGDPGFPGGDPGGGEPGAPDGGEPYPPWLDPRFPPGPRLDWRGMPFPTFPRNGWPGLPMVIRVIGHPQRA